MKILILAASILFSAFFALSCKKDNPIPPGGQPNMNLTLEDVSCTEAWIKIATANLQLPMEAELLKDGVIAKTINIATPDTILYIDSLLPNRSYQFKSTVRSPQSAIMSNEIDVQTMDTTSSNYNFQIYQLGEYQQSRINDIAIINGNDIWAVGEIYLLDSTGVPDANAYNAVHWDGNEWKLLRLQFYTFCGQPSTGSYPTRSILAFSDTDIWITSGSQITHFDGLKQISTECIPVSVNKLWGTDNDNIYAVGKIGKIAHYQNSHWTRIESGTDVDLYDAWGDQNGTVWTCGYSDDYGTSVLLRYRKDDGIETVYSGLSNNQNNGFYIGPISGVWGTNEFRISMMNWSGIYIQANSTRFYLEKEVAEFQSAGYGIDGTGNNNIFACGEGFVGHWNGVNYIEYPEVYREFRTFNCVKVTGNIICAGGFDYNGYIYSQAVITLSK